MVETCSWSVSVEHVWNGPVPMVNGTLWKMACDSTERLNPSIGLRASFLNVLNGHQYLAVILGTS